VVHLDTEAIQTRGYCVAKNATLRKLRAGSFARIAQIPSASSGQAFAAQKTLGQDDSQMHHYRVLIAHYAGDEFSRLGFSIRNFSKRI
jgi:hypothetical protein